MQPSPQIPPQSCHQPSLSSPNMSETNTTASSTQPRPSLHARSRPADPDGYVSEVYPCSNHAIMGPWEDRKNPLQRRIIESLGDIKWFVIDIWRFGYAESYEAIDLQDRSQRPATICVSVRPGSTTAEKMQAAVFRCKQVLDEFGFPDVEVSIEESVGWGSLAER